MGEAMRTDIHVYSADDLEVIGAWVANGVTPNNPQTRCLLTTIADLQGLLDEARAELAAERARRAQAEEKATRYRHERDAARERSAQAAEEDIQDLLRSREALQAQYQERLTDIGNLNAEVIDMAQQLDAAQARSAALAGALRELPCDICGGKGKINSHCWGWRNCQSCQGTGRHRGAAQALAALLAPAADGPVAG